jgi:hypothetical protein
MRHNETAAMRLRRRFLERADGKGESGVAMLTAILFMIIMAGIATIIVSTVLGQVKPSYIAQKSTKTIYAAQAGMQASLAMIRSVAKTPDATGHVYGDATKLPCTVTGRANAQGDGFSYLVTITYYTIDPTHQSDGWRNSAANQLNCGPGGVTPTTGAPVLGFAFLVANGAGPAIPGITNTKTADRSLAAVYAFQVANVNIAGGRILDYTSTFCLAADSATLNSTIHFKSASKCAPSATNDALQLWIYDTDYEIKLASTTVAGYPGGALCITGAAAGNATLTTCATDDSRWSQLWGWVGSNNWQGQTHTSPISASGPSSLHLGAAGAVGDGTILQVTTAGGSFAPSAAVGAAAAGVAKNEIVNYAQFGRCADVAAEQVSNHLGIAYPCKQDPSGGANFTWNQKWIYSEPVPSVPPAAPVTSTPPQQIYVNAVAPSVPGKYCMTPPTTSPKSGDLVTFVLCSSTTYKIWTRVYDTGVYTDSYLFTTPTTAANGSILCLAVDPTKLYSSGNWSEITVATCNGTDLQKWNAPPTYAASTVGGYREIAG